MRSFWEKRTIKAKMLLGIGAILAIFAASSSLVLVLVNTFATSADVAINRVSPARVLALNAKFWLVDADDNAGYYVMDRNAAAWPADLRSFKDDVAAVKDAIPKLRGAADGPREQQLVADLSSWLDDYLKADDQAFAAKRAGHYDLGVRNFVAFDTGKGQKLIADLADSMGARAGAASATATANSRAALVACVVGALAAIASGTLIAFVLGGAISKRLSFVTGAIEEVVRTDIPLLSMAMNRFAAGDLSARVKSERKRAPVTGSDETALLTTSYNNLLDEVEAAGAELTLTGEALSAVIGDVKRTVDCAADGDFSIRLDTAKQTGVFKEIGDNLNRLMDVVARTVSEIKDAADVVSTSAGEIAAGNSDLSQRTEEQASSLEETAASMEELTATVRQNADNAKQANTFAIGASDIALKGGDVVGEVVRTMGEINESGKKIVDIIAVIDGIAFQTNILALNAAVEAARAGEQGRGFAVVAGEVRTLAQRSAAAAKEIKALIGDSVERTSAGTKLVGQAGDTMAEIVSSVKRVTEIMSAISLASVEQGAGIAQVNQAVAQMDKVTQQNAALVEEIAASASSLEERARSLVDFVRVFKLPPAASASGMSERGDARPAAPPRVTQRGGAKAVAASTRAVANRQSDAPDDADGEWASF